MYHPIQLKLPCSSYLSPLTEGLGSHQYPFQILFGNFKPETPAMWKKGEVGIQKFGHPLLHFARNFFFVVVQLQLDRTRAQRFLGKHIAGKIELYFAHFVFLIYSSYLDHS